MEYIDVSINFIIVLLGLAYPIILEVISRLDQRYGSRIITGLFEAEPEWQWFERCLWMALIGVAVYTIGQLPAWHPAFRGDFLSKSGEYFTYFVTIPLIIFFFLFIKKLQRYWVPAKLIRMLQGRPDTADNRHFQALADLLYLGIHTREEAISEEVSQHFSILIRNYWEKHPGRPYPSAYYEMVHRVTRDAVALRDPRLKSVEFRATNGQWFFSGIGYTNIHEATFNHLWFNLLTLVENGRDDLVMQYWGHAHQFMGTGLAVIYPRMNMATRDRENGDEVDQRMAERQQFVDFHLALGGLLLYRGRYHCINRMFIYTTSEPAQYELFPKNIAEIIQAFMRFQDPNGTRFAFTQHIYGFPDMEGLAADRMIRQWICRYIALLLLRQYALPHIYVPLDPLARPAVPPSQGDKRLYSDNLPHFKQLVQEILDDRDLLKATHLDFINEQWCRDNQKVAPVMIVEEFITHIQASFAEAEITQPVSPAKEQAFKAASDAILSERIRSYDVLQNEQAIPANYKEYSISGMEAIMDKSAFAEGQGMTHLNFDTVLASMVADKITTEMSYSIQSRASKRYLLKEEELVTGIGRLQLDPAEHVILNTGIDLGFLASRADVPVSGDSIDGITVITLQYVDHRQLPASLIAMRKTDLPQIRHEEVHQTERNMYNLKLLNEDLLTYGSVVNLHDRRNVRQYWSTTYPPEKLDKSVLLVLSLRMLVRWRTNVPVVMLTRFDRLLQMGLLNELKDVQPFA